MPDEFQAQTLELLIEKACAFGPACPVNLNKLAEIKRWFGGDANEESNRTSLRYIEKYLEHWIERIPKSLSLICDPEEWRISLLLDSTKSKLRKPKVRVDVDFDTRDTFRVKWQPVAHAELWRDGIITRAEWQEATDYKWIGGGTVVELYCDDYPLRPALGGDDDAWREQKTTFLMFLESVLSLLRANVDVQVGDWVMLDEDGELAVTTLYRRVADLAAKQLDQAQQSIDKARADYQEAIRVVDVDEETLLKSLTERDRTAKSLLTIVQSVTGRPILSSHLRAFAEALAALNRQKESLAISEEVLNSVSRTAL